MTQQKVIQVTDYTTTEKILIGVDSIISVKKDKNDDGKTCIQSRAAMATNNWCRESVEEVNNLINGNSVPAKKETALPDWSFIEAYYPDYFRSGIISYSDDLAKLVNDDYEATEDDSAYLKLIEDYGDRTRNLDDIIADYKDSLKSIYVDAITNCIDKMTTEDFIS